MDGSLTADDSKRYFTERLN